MQHLPCGRGKDAAGLGGWDVRLQAPGYRGAGHEALGRLPAKTEMPTPPRGRGPQAPPPVLGLASRPGKDPSRGSREPLSYPLPYLAPGESWAGEAVG